MLFGVLSPRRAPRSWQVLEMMQDSKFQSTMYQTMHSPAMAAAAAEGEEALRRMKEKDPARMTQIREHIGNIMERAGHYKSGLHGGVDDGEL